MPFTVRFSIPSSLGLRHKLKEEEPAWARLCQTQNLLCQLPQLPVSYSPPTSLSTVAFFSAHLPGVTTFPGLPALLLVQALPHPFQSKQARSANMACHIGLS